MLSSKAPCLLKECLKRGRFIYNVLANKNMWFVCLFVGLQYVFPGAVACMHQVQYIIKFILVVI